MARRFARTSADGGGFVSIRRGRGRPFPVAGPAARPAQSASPISCAGPCNPVTAPVYKHVFDMLEGRIDTNF